MSAEEDVRAIERALDRFVWDTSRGYFLADARAALARLEARISEYDRVTPAWDRLAAKEVRRLEARISEAERERDDEIENRWKLEARIAELEQERDAVGENADSTLRLFQASEARIVELEGALLSAEIRNQELLDINRTLAPDEEGTEGVEE